MYMDAHVPQALLYSGAITAQLKYEVAIKVLGVCVSRVHHTHARARTHTRTQQTHTQHMLTMLKDILYSSTHSLTTATTEGNPHPVSFIRGRGGRTAKSGMLWFSW